MINLPLISATLTVIGDIIIGVAVLLVHRRLIGENKIDDAVIKEMKSEQLVGLIGIAFLILGYLINLQIL